MQSVLEILDKCAGYFASKGVPDAKLDAQILLAHALGCKRLDLFLRFDEPLPETRLSVFREMAKRRAKREPLQHIVGTVEFFGLTLKSDGRALVPRHETEELCDIITREIFTDKAAEISVLDLGTGTGAIALALAKYFPNSKVAAADLSEEAIALAKENAEAVGANVEFVKSDWFENISGRFDLIVANPPYLTDAEVAAAEPEVRDFDPVNALVSPDNGLADLRKILRSAKNFLNENGALACECGVGQPEVLAKEALENLGFSRAESICDLSGRQRFLVCRP